MLKQLTKIEKELIKNTVIIKIIYILYTYYVEYKNFIFYLVRISWTMKIKAKCSYIYLKKLKYIYKLTSVYKSCISLYFPFSKYSLDKNWNLSLSIRINCYMIKRF